MDRGESFEEFEVLSYNSRLDKTGLWIISYRTIQAVKIESGINHGRFLQQSQPIWASDEPATSCTVAIAIGVVVIVAITVDVVIVATVMATMITDGRIDGAIVSIGCLDYYAGIQRFNHILHLDSRNGLGAFERR